MKVKWNVDAATYLGDGEDGVYYLAAKSGKKWYVTVVVDSNTGGFVMDIYTDHGPFDTEEDAKGFGENAAYDWCVENGVNTDEQ
jgi:hypothetical protein